MKKRMFCDVETSGLDANKNQILTLALVVYDDRVEVGHLHVLIKQNSWAVIEPQALAVNCIDLEAHNKVALTEEEAYVVIASFIKEHLLYRTTPYGHNTSFDVGFLKSFFSRLNKQYPFSYHTGDSMVLALSLMDANIIPTGKVNLKILCEARGIVADWHTALGDARACARLYFSLVDKIKEETS